jgi:hypothetical protein
LKLFIARLWMISKMAKCRDGLFNSARLARGIALVFLSRRRRIGLRLRGIYRARGDSSRERRRVMASLCWGNGTKRGDRSRRRRVNCPRRDTGVSGRYKMRVCSGLNWTANLDYRYEIAPRKAFPFRDAPQKCSILLLFIHAYKE